MLFLKARPMDYYGELEISKKFLEMHLVSNEVTLLCFEHSVIGLADFFNIHNHNTISIRFRFQAIPRLFCMCYQTCSHNINSNSICRSKWFRIILRLLFLWLLCYILPPTSVVLNSKCHSLPVFHFKLCHTCFFWLADIGCC